MKIAELIGKLDYHFNTLAGEVIMDHDRVRALRGTEVSGIVNDSRKISKDCLFFCIVGAVRDGHEFARQALLDGAAALVVQKDLDLSDLEGKTPVKEPVIIRVQDTRYAIGLLRKSGFPDEDHRRHRNQRKDHHDLYGEVDPGSRGI